MLWPEMARRLAIHTAVANAWTEIRASWKGNALTQTLRRDRCDANAAKVTP